MTLKFPDSTKHARIVHMFCGSVQRLQLRHVPSNWVIHSKGKEGPDLVSSVESLRRLAQRQSYVVDEGFTVEDWRPITEMMMRS